MDGSNSRLELARKIVENTGCSLFLTGKAGTGKTTFLRELRATSRKRMVVTAPTGIAAINAGGVTLHSFFQLDFGPYVPGAKRNAPSNRRSMAFSKEKIRIIRGLDLLVIDEVSMVRSDMLDAVDDVLRRFRDRTLPFGGVQLLLIGDLQQLPPVVVESERSLMEANYASPYFFDSHALAAVDYVTVELTEVYRQNDAGFLELLNAVRDNRADDAILSRLNARCIPGFNPSDREGYVRLTTHNRLANDINRTRMEALQSEPHLFVAEVEGNFPESSYPADRELVLKEGAQVMFIKNDTGMERRFFNGMLGTVTAIDDEGVIVTPTDGTDQIGVEPMEWENVKFVVNEETKEITEKREGAFRQLPLKPAWAITIHKSQGLTFDRAIIDTSLSFTHGQTYVALSRCRTLEGLVLDRPIPRSAIITDPTVSRFLSTHSADDLSDSRVSSMSHAYYMHLIGDMFNFRPVFEVLEGVTRIIKENFARLYPAMVMEYSDSVEELRKTMCDVGDRFRAQLQRIDAEGNGEEPNGRLLQRVKDAAAYFTPLLRNLRTLVAGLPESHDSRNVTQKLAERVEMFNDMAEVRETLLDTFTTEDFEVSLYLDIKAKGAFSDRKQGSSRQRKKKVAAAVTDDNVNPILMDALTDWRRSKAAAAGAPAYTVASTRTLLAVSNHLPRTYEDLALLPGIGPVMISRHGDELLDLVEAYIASGIKTTTLPATDSRTDKHTESQADSLSVSKAASGKTAEKKPRLSRKESQQLSLKLFLDGKSIYEAAEERGLRPSTIFSHIIELIDLSDETIFSRLVPYDVHEAVKRYFDSHDTLPSTYDEVLAAIASECHVEPDKFMLRAMMIRYGRRTGAADLTADAGSATD